MYEINVTDKFALNNVDLNCREIGKQVINLMHLLVQLFIYLANCFVTLKKSFLKAKLITAVTLRLITDEHFI